MPIEVRRSDWIDADVVVQDPETGPRCHRALLDQGLDAQLLEALRELPGEQIGTYRQVLAEIGVDALDGMLADLAANAAGALEWAEDRDFDVSRHGFEADIPDSAAVPGRKIARRHGADPIELFLDVVESLGSGMSALGTPTDRDDVHDALPPLFGQAVDTEPRVVVDLSGAWFERRAEQREDVLEFLLDLAHGCSVTIRPTASAARRLYEAHRVTLPAHVTERLDPGRPAPASTRGDVPARVVDVVEDAREALDPDSTAAAALRAIRGTQSDAMTYRDLRRELRLKDDDDSHARVIGKRLDDLGLVERLDGSDGFVRLSLTPAGQQLLGAWRSDCGEQTAFVGPGVPDPDPSGSDRGRYAPPKNLLPCRVSPAEVGGPHPQAAAEAAAEAAAADSRDRTDDYAHGAVDLSWMTIPREAAVLGASRDGEIALCNAEIERLQDSCGDGREPSLSYNSREQTLVVGAEYHNPMQFWVATARALASPQVWRNVLDAGWVGDELQHLETNDVELLRDARCLGWLPDDAVDDYDELADQIGQAYSELLDLSRDLKHENYEDRDAFRSELLGFAHGLAGTMTHLLDLAGIDVVREVRIPDFSDDFSQNGHRDQRLSLCKTLAVGAAIQSRYGHFATFRQLLEDRPDKIEQAMEPTVDAEDPLAEMHGGIVVVGHGVDGLQEDLRRVINRPTELREDAPEIAIRLPVRTADSPTTTRRVAKIAGQKKNIEMTTRAINALHGCCRSAYAVAEAVGALEAESLGREIHMDELRVGIGSLDDDRLLPDGTPAARSGLLALVRAERPISQAELCRRAGISAQSWRNHRDVLQAAGLVDLCPEGWRCTLPFHDERYDDDALEDVAEPWILDPATDVLPAGPAHREAIDAVDELAIRLDQYDDPVVQDALGWPKQGRPPPDAALRSIGAGILARFVEALGDLPAPPPVEALLGPDLEQTALPALQHPQKSPNEG